MWVNPDNSNDRWVLILDDDGKVSIDNRTSDGEPASWWNREVLVWTICSSGVVDQHALTMALSNGGWLSELLDRVVAGYEVKWTGSGYRGQLTEEAEEAYYEIDSRLYHDGNFSDPDWSVWDAAEWLHGDSSSANTLSNMGLTINSTDEEIVAAAKAAETEAEDNKVLLYNDAEDAIRSMIKYVREQTEDEEAA